jgi:ABC-type glycerol-3-phosphate transport system permease component
MILFILAAYFAYKKAKSTGRNGILWAFITAGVYIGMQLLLGIGIGIFLAVGVEFFGWSETVYNDFNLLISAVCIIGSFGGVWLVFRYLDKIPEEETFAAPPPPPTFDGK